MRTADERGTTIAQATAGAPAEVGLSIHDRPAHTIVRLHGDLVFATAPSLRERLLGAFRPGTRLLVLDLSGVRCCDAAGAAVLIGAQRHAARLGITLRLAAPHPGVAKVLRGTGLERNLSLHPTQADALAAPLPGPKDAKDAASSRRVR